MVGGISKRYMGLDRADPQGAPQGHDTICLVQETSGSSSRCVDREEREKRVGGSDLEEIKEKRGLFVGSLLSRSPHASNQSLLF